MPKSLYKVYGITLLRQVRRGASCSAVLVSYRKDFTTHLAKTVHPPVVRDADNLVAERRALFRRRRPTESIVLSAVRHDNGRSALNDVNRDIERPRQSLNLDVSCSFDSTLNIPPARHPTRLCSRRGGSTPCTAPGS